MNEFRAGTYRKERVGGVWRSVCPRESTMSLLDVDPAALAEEGKRLVLLDVDNTLLPWRGDQIPESSFGWIEAAKAAGLKLCILSNTRHPERLHRIADQLGIQYLRGKFKPSTQMYVRALHDFGVKAPEAVMIGDQLFTDVLGANRSGIDAIWVRPMTERDFVGTKISRMGEKLARRTLDRHIKVDAAEDLPPNLVGLAALLQVPVVRQFVKFIIVGGSSTVIDVGLHFTLMFVIVISGLPVWITPSGLGPARNGADPRVAPELRNPCRRQELGRRPASRGRPPPSQGGARPSAGRDVSVAEVTRRCRRPRRGTAARA